MDSSSSPSPRAKQVTEGQISKTSGLLRAAIEKNRSDFSSSAVQETLEISGKRLQDELMVVFRRHVSFHINIIRREVIVDRNCHPQQILGASGFATGEDRTLTCKAVNRDGETDFEPLSKPITKYVKFVDDEVLVAIPRCGTGIEAVTVEFFIPNRHLTEAELAQEYRERGLVPDPFAQMAVNRDDPEFAKIHPNATHWRNPRTHPSHWGKHKSDWHCLVFCYDYGKPCVHVSSGVQSWCLGRWFGGVRKK